jgi:hypothetical protein
MLVMTVHGSSSATACPSRLMICTAVSSSMTDAAPGVTAECSLHKCRSVRLNTFPPNEAWWLAPGNSHYSPLPAPPGWPPVEGGQADTILSDRNSRGDMP